MKKYMPRSAQETKRLLLTAMFVLAAFFLVLGAKGADAQSNQSGSSGLTGTITAPPPSEGAVILNPSNGDSFSAVPITVSGTCQDGLLVEIFKNNIFSGSTQCMDSKFSIQIDLYVGKNDLVARGVDALDQSGPDSNTVSVTYSKPINDSSDPVYLTSDYAKRGADVGQTLTWPITLSGGLSPYAFSVDWGDGTELDLFTATTVGEIILSHIYINSGTYNIVVRVVDSNGESSILQLVGVGNGEVIVQNDVNTVPASSSTSDGNITLKLSVILFVSVPLLILVVISTFWLGKRYMYRKLRKIYEKGENPFSKLGNIR